MSVVVFEQINPELTVKDCTQQLAPLTLKKRAGSRLAMRLATREKTRSTTSNSTQKSKSTMATSTPRLALGALALVVASVTLGRHLLPSQDDGHDVRLLLEQLEELRTKHEDLSERILSSSRPFTDVDDSSHTTSRQLQTSSSSNCTGGFTYASSFGLAGDSRTDDHAALTAALASAAGIGNDHHKGGGVVVLPPGTFRINEPLIIPAGVTLQGQGYGSSPLAIQVSEGSTFISE